MLPRSWSTNVTIICLTLVACVEAAQSALSGTPNVKAHLPSFAISPNWNYVPLVLLIIAGIAWLIGKRNKKQPVPLKDSSPVAASGPQATSRIEYFDLGLALARLKQFDAQYVPDLRDQCEALGLTEGTAKFDRIMKTFNKQLDVAEIEGGGEDAFLETNKVFDFEMQDMEDAIRIELARQGRRQ